MSQNVPISSTRFVKLAFDCLLKGNLTKPANEICVICDEASDYMVVSPCNDRFCWKCSVRLRGLNKDFNCPFCKMETPVVCYSDIEFEFDESTPEMQTMKFNSALGVYFRDEHIEYATELILHFQCWHPDCCLQTINRHDGAYYRKEIQNRNDQNQQDYESHIDGFSGTDVLETINKNRIYSDLVSLQQHLRRKHRCQYCSSCYEQWKRTRFISELDMYNVKDLSRHNHEGENRKIQPIARHYLCTLCTLRCFDWDAYISHCKNCHLICSYCTNEKSRVVLAFGDEESYYEHARLKHLLCPFSECEQIMNNELEFQLHIATHGNENNSKGRSTVPIGYGYGSRNQSSVQTSSSSMPNHRTGNDFQRNRRNRRTQNDAASSSTTPVVREDCKDIDVATLNELLEGHDLSVMESLGKVCNSFCVKMVKPSLNSSLKIERFKSDLRNDLKNRVDKNQLQRLGKVSHDLASHISSTTLESLQSLEPDYHRLSRNVKSDEFRRSQTALWVSRVCDVIRKLSHDEMHILKEYINVCMKRFDELVLEEEFPSISTTIDKPVEQPGVVSESKKTSLLSTFLNRTTPSESSALSRKKKETFSEHFPALSSLSSKPEAVAGSWISNDQTAKPAQQLITSDNAPELDCSHDFTKPSVLTKQPQMDRPRDRQKPQLDAPPGCQEPDHLDAQPGCQKPINLDAPPGLLKPNFIDVPPGLDKFNHMDIPPGLHKPNHLDKVHDKLSDRPLALSKSVDMDNRVVLKKAVDSDTPPGIMPPQPGNFLSVSQPNDILTSHASEKIPSQPIDMSGSQKVNDSGKLSFVSRNTSPNSNSETINQSGCMGTWVCHTCFFRSNKNNNAVCTFCSYVNQSMLNE